MPNVILADDEEFVRYFLKTIMDSLFFDVVAEVEKGDELIAAMREYQPDILLLDINMPNLTGIEFLNKYSEEFQNTCIIILTSATSAQLMTEASTKGAKCFLRKDTPPEKMVVTIKDTWEQFRKDKNV